MVKLYRFLKFFLKDLLQKGYFYRYIKKIGYNNPNPHDYDEDGMMLNNKNLSFLTEPLFLKAYSRGVQAAAGRDFNFQFRVYILLWAAEYCAQLKGDFVECGTARGFCSSAIMDFLNWNTLSKKFYLLDTFDLGVQENLLTNDEKKTMGPVDAFNIKMRNGVYADCFDEVVKNFIEYNNVEIIRGVVPDTLKNVKANSISFLHIDMNCAMPEIEAIKYFWPLIEKGGIIILDDYAHRGHEVQKNAFDLWKQEMNVPLLILPTGQGLIIKA